LGLPEADNPYLAVGTERNWSVGPKTSFALRAGYNTRTLGQVDNFTGFTFGGGLTFGTLSIDYAFLPMGPLGNTQRVSISLKFDWNRFEHFVVLKMPKASNEPAPPQSIEKGAPWGSKVSCEMFHSVDVCEVPFGTFFLKYPLVNTTGGESYQTSPDDKPSLDLFPRAISIKAVPSTESAPDKEQN
jgi:hypothetical protein